VFAESEAILVSIRFCSGDSSTCASSCTSVASRKASPNRAATGRYHVIVADRYCHAAAVVAAVL